ncbi:endonuclease NucS domain-containing protein [Halanaerobium hydrogeniformans]|uniref:endonuclease NucS domain-containing protein n=1 Tax=Halanaerobium hydrogeniformans TaxID=656519 RepID=UPI000305E202|nr:endonuclease NucS domain-containing protein [Halanaerobium hydrogeniformans]
MPIEVGFWKLNNNQIEKIEFTSIESENKLENILESDISILSDDIFLLGRQILTSYGKFIDMLGMDMEGNLNIIELKKDKTPRDVVAQTLDYASWVQNLSYEDISHIYSENNNGKNIEKAFYEKFDTDLPDTINETHNILIVAAELDFETERIINYLSDNYNVPINAVFFRYFKEAENDYISRTWLINPNEVEEKKNINKNLSKSEPWNGRDFVVNIENKNETE